MLSVAAKHSIASAEQIRSERSRKLNWPSGAKRKGWERGLEKQMTRNGTMEGHPWSRKGGEIQMPL